MRVMLASYSWGRTRKAISIEKLGIEQQEKQ